MNHWLFDCSELVTIADMDCGTVRVVDAGGGLDSYVPGGSMSEDNNLDARIKALVGRIFEIRPEDVTERTRRGELERWDSLNHLALLTALQEEFHIEIPPEQALEMETLGDIKRAVISSRGAAPSS